MTTDLSPSSGRVIPNGRYPLEEVDRGLLALVLAGGQAEEANRVLKDQGVENPPSAKTLRAWREKSYPHGYADRYLEFHREVLPAQKARAAEDFSHLASEAVALSQKIGDRLETELEKIPARDLPTAYRNTATAAGIATDKAANLRGEPTEVIHRHIEAVDVMRVLKERGVTFPEEMDRAIDSTAEEVPADAD